LLKGGLQQVDKVIRSNGKPVYIERKTNPSKSDPDSSPAEKLSRFLEETRIISGTINPKEHFAITQINEDRNGITHLKTIQRYKEIDIYGSEATFHLSAQKERFTGLFHNIENEINTVPVISSASAITTGNLSMSLKCTLALRIMQEYI